MVFVENFLVKNFFFAYWSFYFYSMPSLAIWIFWNQIPDRISMNRNFPGEIDRCDDKIPGIFYIPALNLFFYLLFMLIPCFDPVRKNYELFSKRYQMIKLVAGKIWV
jgi:hypothetical protein